jgi:hypothetical protein
MFYVNTNIHGNVNDNVFIIYGNDIAVYLLWLTHNCNVIVIIASHCDIKGTMGSQSYL